MATSGSGGGGGGVILIAARELDFGETGVVSVKGGNASNPVTDPSDPELGGGGGGGGGAIIAVIGEIIADEGSWNTDGGTKTNGLNGGSTGVDGSEGGFFFHSISVA